MKKLKYSIWLLLAGFLGMLIYQNQTLFLAKYSLDINLGVTRYHIPEIYVVVMIAIFFFAGILVAYAAGLIERYRAHQNIRALKRTIDSYSGTISTLKQEVAALKPHTQSAIARQDVAPESGVTNGAETVQNKSQ